MRAERADPGRHDGDRSRGDLPPSCHLVGEGPGRTDHPSAAPRLGALQPPSDERPPALHPGQPLMLLDDEVGGGQAGHQGRAGMQRVPPRLSLPLTGLDDVEAAETAQCPVHRQGACHGVRSQAPRGDPVDPDFVNDLAGELTGSRNEDMDLVPERCQGARGLLRVGTDAAAGWRRAGADHGYPHAWKVAPPGGGGNGRSWRLLQPCLSLAWTIAHAGWEPPP